MDQLCVYVLLQQTVYESAQLSMGIVYLWLCVLQKVHDGLRAITRDNTSEKTDNGNYQSCHGESSSHWYAIRQLDSKDG